MWVDCLIYPVILAHLFVWAEKEGNWVLHLWCCKCMLAYFMAAGHWHYARYLFWYILEFHGLLPQDSLKTVYFGHHVCRHKPGSWNSVFSDQFGEHVYLLWKSKGWSERTDFVTRSECILGTLLPYVQHGIAAYECYVG